MTDLPTEHSEKLALLNRGFEIGARVAELSWIGAPVGPLRDYLATEPQVEIETSAGHLTAIFAGHVRWQVSLGAEGRIEGTGSSGFGPLMSALGIDFSGAPYSAGDGF